MNNKRIITLCLFFLLGVLVSLVVLGLIAEPKDGTTVTEVVSQEEAVISVVEQSSHSVVNVIATKDLPIYEQRMREDNFFFWPYLEEIGREEQEVGGGTGFIVASDGLIITNRHVVNDSEANYTVVLSDGERFPAEIVVLDPVYDLAVLRINKTGLSAVSLGDSDTIRIGQSAIAIGNALGELRNTVSVGVISGLGRMITATDGRTVSRLEDVIQTDAAINQGNSGGPLFNLQGQVIGINTAVAIGAQNIGFAIPVNRAKKIIKDIETLGRVSYPFLGVRYSPSEDGQGAVLVAGEEGEPAIHPGSSADEAGLQEGDVILEINGEKIDRENTLGHLIMKYQSGDEVEVKYRRQEEEKVVIIKLGEMER